MKHACKNDLYLLFFLPLMSALILNFIKVNAFIIVSAYLVPAAIYLTVLQWGFVKKALLFSGILSLPLVIIYEYIGVSTHQWKIAEPLPLKLFGRATIEMIWAGFLHTYCVILFYRHFLSKPLFRKAWSNGMNYLSAIIVSVFSFFLIAHYLFPHLLEIPFWYTWFGFLFEVVPIMVVLFLRPSKLVDFLKVAPYFFFLNFLIELTGLRSGAWSFPSHQFLGWVSLMGVRFPVEELIFWFLGLPLATLSFFYLFYERSGDKNLRYQDFSAINTP